MVNYYHSIINWTNVHLNNTTMVVPQSIIIDTDSPQVEQSIWSVFNDSVSIKSNVLLIQPLLGEFDEVTIEGDDGWHYVITKDSWGE